MTARQVFDGISVLDFSWAGVGPITTKYLADYGATVVRVESTSRPCILRTTPPYKDGIVGMDRAGYFAIYGPNKYSMTINMKHPKRTELVNKLVGWADVVAESFTAGVMESWGLGYEQMSKIKPDIIVYRTNMQGHSGPHSSLPGTGVNLVGLSGFAHLCGWPDRTPSNPYGPYTDIIAPRFGAVMLIGALDYKRKTGKGQLIEMSQFEAGVNFIAPLMLDYFVNGRVATRRGNECSHAAPHNAYRCRGQDRWCVIAVFSDEEWTSFCEVIGNPPWTKDVKFSTFLGRKKNEVELDRHIEGWTANHRAEDVMAMMQAKGVNAGVVKKAEDLYQDPQLKKRNHFWVMDHKELGPFSYLGEAAVLSETPAQPRLPSPCLGEHNEYVCKEILGMSEADFDQLVVEGVFD
jgi:crotonobetainyl-CoA:carnitine CoA-transferase CaiB-like acyl-CoA transferase